MKKIRLKELHDKYIEGSAKGVVVEEVTVLLCHMAKTIKISLRFKSPKIYINTKVLKHLFDKRPEFEYQFILKKLPKIVGYPDEIYKATTAKRGDFYFIKNFDKDYYLCSIQRNIEPVDLTMSKKANYVVTCFRLRASKRKNYLKNYKLLWSWKDDNPSS